MGIVVRGPFTEAQSPAEIDLGFDVNREWHEITISIFDDTGAPATSGVTGTMTGSVRKVGADRTEAFTETLNLAADQRSWDPELSRAEVFFIDVSGLNANYTYTVTVNSWGDT